MPGGEWHVKENWDVPQQKGDKDVAFVRGAFPDDLIALSIWADAVHRDGRKPYLIIPYLPGARQDRRQEGESLSCKIFAELINRCKFEKVVCLDPHSDVMPTLIDNLDIMSIGVAIHADIFSNGPYIVNELKQYAGVIVPDAGAIKRANIAAWELGKLPTYQALKKRDMSSGKLSGFTCEKLPDTGRFLVVDDICDGGGTFKGLAKATGLPKERLGLWVTFGIFSKGAEELPNYYSNIYTTDGHPGRIDITYDHEFMRILRRVELRDILLKRIYQL